MKRFALVGAFALLALLVALELAVRGGGRTVQLDPGDVFEPGRRGFCGGAWLETDAQGQRRGASAWLAQPRGRAIVAVGGAFTAGAGLEDDELWPARLEPHARAGGCSGVIALTAREDKPALARRALDALARDGVLVVEIDGRDLGGSPEPFEIAGPARRLDPVEPSALAAVTWARLVALRRERRRIEDEIAVLVERDGFTGRASSREKLRLESLTRAAAERRLDAGQARRLRAWIEELHGLRRGEERAARLEEWRSLFEEARLRRQPAVLLVTGATATTLSLVQAARDCAWSVVHAPPFELDPDLRVDSPHPRPAVAVHRQVADSLRAELSRRRLLEGASAPARVLDAADAIEQHVLTRGGFDEATIALADAQIESAVAIGAGEPPPCVLHGVGADGLLAPDGVAEVVLRRPPFPGSLLLHADVEGFEAPRVALRHALGGAAADAQPARGRTTAAPERSFEWVFRPPAARGPIDRRALEFSLLPGPGGSPPEAIRLREIRFVSEPP